MQEFKYTAKRSTLEVEEGLLEAESAKDAVELLKHKGLYPIRLVNADESDDGLSALRRKLPSWLGGQRLSLSTERRSLLARQLADLLGGGLTVHMALSVLKRQAGDAQEHRALLCAANEVQKGASLSTALEGSPVQLFSSSSIASMQAGEQSGSLVSVLSNTADQLDRTEHMHRKIREAVTYPVLVTIVGFVTLVLLVTFVIPRLASLYLDMQQVLPLPTRMVLGVSEVVKLGIIPLLVAVGLGGIAWSRVERLRNSVRAKINNLVMRLPFVGKLIRWREIVSFARGLSTLLHGGVPLAAALKWSANAAGHPQFREQLLEIQTVVCEGQSLGDALERRALFAGPLASMAQVGEASGQLAASLDKAAVLYERNLDAFLGKMLKILEPVLILLIGFLVAFVVYALMLPILQLNLGVS